MYFVRSGIYNQLNFYAPMFFSGTDLIFTMHLKLHMSKSMGYDSKNNIISKLLFHISCKNTKPSKWSSFWIHVNIYTATLSISKNEIERVGVRWPERYHRGTVHSLIQLFHLQRQDETISISIFERVLHLPAN